MLIRFNSMRAFALVSFFFFSLNAFSAPPSITGQLKKWHKITLTFDGPTASEQGTPNPFLDYRMDVTFSIGSHSYTIPGYFAADGNAAETSADTGSKWRVHFAPDSVGTWTYTASFRAGTDIAVDPSVNAGTPVANAFDGETGTFTVGPTDKTGNDFRSKGRLEYVGGHYLQFAETGEFYLKAGTDAPENLLAYYEFDNTRCYGGASNRKTKNPQPYTANGQTFMFAGDTLHHYDAHLTDWNTGDPVWQTSKGKRIIGALNYLASKGLNVISFLTMNIAGDARDVHPFVNYNDNASPQDDRKQYDISKLEQWEIVFSHADSLGLLLHVKTQETENDQLLDGGQLGTERILYYRMLIALYGHHLALEWNLGEENDIWTELNDPNNTLLQSYFNHFQDFDPYHHPIVVHSYPGQQNQVFTPLLGLNSMTGASLQTDQPYNVHEQTLGWVSLSSGSGQYWVTTSDEIGPASWGVKPDGAGNNHFEVRSQVIWGNYMAGGGGIQHYFGYNTLHHDIDCEWFGSRDTIWDYSRIAREFFETLPVNEMSNQNALIGNTNDSNDKYCFAKPGEVYAIYLPNGGTTNLDLGSVSGSMDVEWYDPRNGGNFLGGTVTSVAAGGTVSIGFPPNNINEDWVAIVRDSGSLLPVEWLSFTGEAVNTDVILNWSTASETNNDFFEVQRSVDGNIWENIGQVDASGNALTVKHYAFKDAGLDKGTYSYRIRQVDFDGNSSLSSRIEVTILETEAKLRVFPAPARDFIQVKVEGTDQTQWDYSLVDVSGRQILTGSFQMGNTADLHKIELSAIPDGVYFFSVNSRESVFTQRIIKSR